MGAPVGDAGNTWRGRCPSDGPRIRAVFLEFLLWVSSQKCIQLNILLRGTKTVSGSGNVKIYLLLVVLFYFVSSGKFDF